MAIVHHLIGNGSVSLCSHSRCLLSSSSSRTPLSTGHSIMEPYILDPAALLEDEDPFQFLLDDRNAASPPIEEKLAEALSRFRNPKCDIFAACSRSQGLTSRGTDKMSSTMIRCRHSTTLRQPCRTPPCTHQPSTATAIAPSTRPARSQTARSTRCRRKQHAAATAARTA